MHIYRVYACDPRLIDRRLQLLIESTGCSTACGHYTQLSVEDVADSVALDERMGSDPTAIPYFKWMAREGYTVYLVEVWCRYIEGGCSVQTQCSPEQFLSKSHPTQLSPRARVLDAESQRHRPRARG